MHSHQNEWPPSNNPYYQEPPPTKKRTKMAVVIAITALVLVFACAGVVAALTKSGGDDKTVTQPIVVTSTATKAKPKTTTAAPVQKRVPQIGSGEYLVGKDVTAGRYRTGGADDSMVPLCTWTTAKDTGYSNVTDVGAINGLTETAYVTLKNGQYFKTTGCQPWVKQQ